MYFFGDRSAAGRVGLGGSFRGLYLGLLVAGLCGILSGSLLLL